MSDEQQQAEVQNAEVEQGGNSGYTPPATQADLDRIIADRLSRERAKFADYGDLKAKAAQFDAQAEASKSDLEKATDAAEQAKRDAEDARQELARERVARRHGLSDEDVELLSGDEEQMERLAARIAQAASPQPAGDADAAPKSGPVPGIGKVPEVRNISISDQIAAAAEAGDKSLVATLKAMQLAAGVANPTS